MDEHWLSEPDALRSKSNIITLYLPTISACEDGWEHQGEEMMAKVDELMYESDARGWELRGKGRSLEDDHASAKETIVRKDSSMLV